MAGPTLIASPTLAASPAPVTGHTAPAGMPRTGASSAGSLLVALVALVVLALTLVLYGLLARMRNRLDG